MIDNYDCPLPPACGAMLLAHNPITHPMANGDGKSKSVEITNWIREVPEAPLQNIHQRCCSLLPARPASSYYGSSYFSSSYCIHVLLQLLSSSSFYCHKFHNLSYTQLCYALCSAIFRLSLSLSLLSPAQSCLSLSHSISIFLSSVLRLPLSFSRLHSVNNRRRQQQ